MAKDYCPYCRKVTAQVKDLDEKLCKRCGKKTKRVNPANLLI
jgi:rRNA maturation endonuclease Nob1